jgi:hypothetical protein
MHTLVFVAIVLVLVRMFLVMMYIDPLLLSDFG